MLPFEVPPSYSNQGFYEFVNDYNLSFDGEVASWISRSPAADLVIKLLLGRTLTETAAATGNVKSVRVAQGDYTIPFSFVVGRGGGQIRRLAVPHPRSQLAVSAFYSKFAPSLLYYTDRGSFSIRHPAKISRFSYDDDQLHRRLRSTWSRRAETTDRETEAFSSYFTYEQYTNVYKFFESDRFQEFEKRYSKLLRLDVSKCFDSIYTHSIAWAVYGKDNVKETLRAKQRRKSFPEQFDYLMQRLNYNETNGIVVGPEFSRIFAEVILQTVDAQVEEKLLKQGLVSGDDYEIRRYVDDYFVFTDDERAERVILDALGSQLSAFNLHLNTQKQEHLEMPDVSPLSIAKLRISKLFETSLKMTPYELGSGDLLEQRFRANITSRRIITEYKTVIKETGVNANDIINYALSVIERRTFRLIRKYARTTPTKDEESRFVQSLIGIVKLAFFVYSTSPRVNPTIKVGRLVSHIATFAERAVLSSPLRMAVFDQIAREIRQILAKPQTHTTTSVERMYLLAALTPLGPGYLLSQEDLLTYFEIEPTAPFKFTFLKELDYFGLVALLHYIQGRDRFEQLRKSLEREVKVRITALHCDAAERIMLTLDVVACPFVDEATKLWVLGKAGIKLKADRLAIIQLRRVWFTKWTHFDLGSELDRKRHQEVY